MKEALWVIISVVGYTIAPWRATERDLVANVGKL